MWTLALVLHIFHFGYHQLTTHLDLYPFNNIRSYAPPQKVSEVGLHSIIIGFAIVVLYFRNYNLTGIALCGLGILLIEEFMSWWRYYFFGSRSPRKIVYEKALKDTIHILPTIKDHPKPNLELCILHVTTLICFICTFWLWMYP